MTDRAILLAGETLGANLGLRNALRYVAGDSRLFMPQPAEVDALLENKLVEKVDASAWKLSQQFRLTDLGTLALGLIGERG